jgi:hypothetical protein
MNPQWQAALGFALVGARLQFFEPGGPDPQALLTELASAGWSVERISVHAHQVVADEQPWPHPVPSQLRAGCGPAQFYAALTRVRLLLGLESMETRPPSGRSKLNPDEVRLMREVPPHHGH